MKISDLKRKGWGHKRVEQGRQIQVMVDKRKITFNKSTQINLDEKTTTIKTDGFSIIELIAVLGVLAALTSLAFTQLTRYFKYLELDETFAHVNEISAQCLNDLGKNNNSSEKNSSGEPIAAEPTAAVVDTALLDKNSFEISGSNSNCHYFELKPKTAGGENDLRFGFGIYKGRVTKFAISNADSMDTDCERWAGSRYCIKNASSTTSSGYNTYFDHMEAARKERITCEASFKGQLPTHTGNDPVQRWDSSAESTCPLDAKENSDTSYKTATCTATNSGCTKDSYIFDGKFVGYSASDYTASTSAACATSLDTYLSGLSETAAPETKNDVANCDGKTFYICNRQSQASETEWKACKIKQEVIACEIDLKEEAEKDEIADQDRSYTVPGQGLPPCGVTYTICNKAVYNSPADSPNKDCAAEP